MALEPKLFLQPENNNPSLLQRLGFGRAGSITENMTFANFLTWLEANLTFPAGDTLQETVEIGDWDMDTTGAKNVSYTPPAGKKVVGFRAYIRPGTTSGTVTDQLKPLVVSDTGTDVAGNEEYAPTPNEIQLTRITSGYYDQPSYGGTGFNRGYIVVSLTDV